MKTDRMIAWHERDKNFTIVDASMNDLVHPALYEAWHKIIPVRQRREAQRERYDVPGRCAKQPII